MTYTKYWFQGKFLLTKQAHKELTKLNFFNNTNIIKQLHFDKDIFDTLKTYIIFIYLDSYDKHWNKRFETFCESNNIPIQKWSKP